MGALGELLDNVFEHSGRPESGVVAYAASEAAFEFVVVDAGRGVLSSQRENPEFSGLTNSGTALRVAASDGASRHARSTGHGYGIGRLFRALAHDAAELRFRSGDNALRLWGVKAVPGFGPVLTDKLMRWRRSVENTFAFNMNAPTDPRDIAAVRTDIAMRRSTIETGLINGIRELETLRSEALAKRHQAKQHYAAYIAFRQAEADATHL